MSEHEQNQSKFRKGVKYGAAVTGVFGLVGGIGAFAFSVDHENRDNTPPSPVTESGIVFEGDNFTIGRLSSQIFEVWHGTIHDFNDRETALRIIDDNYGCDIKSVGIDDAANPQFDHDDVMYVVVEEGSCKSAPPIS